MVVMVMVMAAEVEVVMIHLINNRIESQAKCHTLPMIICNIHELLLLFIIITNYTFFLTVKVYCQKF